jgi:ligand-binding sensor domain-containing protein
MRCLNFIWLLLVLALQTCPALALESKVPLGEYHHDIWTGKDGAPGEVACMAQTADGWLWIGGSGGLYRFDGVRFHRFEPWSGGEAPKRPVTSLTALRNGDLLVGYIYGGSNQYRRRSDSCINLAPGKRSRSSQ